MEWSTLRLESSIWIWTFSESAAQEVVNGVLKGTRTSGPSCIYSTGPAMDPAVTFVVAGNESHVLL
jgi:hypothetical protein